MDNLIEQYKEKINDLINTNQSLLDRIEHLENQLKTKSELKNENYEDEKNNYLSKIDSLKISKTEKEVSNLNTSNQINETNHEIKNNNIQINNLSLNKRLLEKIKEVQSLEESLKEKNKIIEKQKSEIEKLSTELKKKNVKINI
jgi:chromosome segregation ATPase